MLKREDTGRVRYPWDLAWTAVTAATLTALYWGYWGRTAAGQSTPWPDGPLGIALGFACGLALWPLVEYTTHRWLLHRIPPLRQWHKEHHRAPQREMTIPIAYLLPLLGLLAALPPLIYRTLDGGGGPGFGAGLGLLGGFALHQWVHHQLHLQPPPRGGWLGKRRDHHVGCHHADPRRCFGTLTSIWDRLFASR